MDINLEKNISYQNKKINLQKKLNNNKIYNNNKTKKDNSLIENIQSKLNNSNNKPEQNINNNISININNDKSDSERNNNNEKNNKKNKLILETIENEEIENDSVLIKVPNSTTNQVKHPNIKVDKNDLNLNSLNKDENNLNKKKR